MTPADWGTEQTIAASGAGLTYCNPHQLTNESGKIYSFSRNLNYNPTIFSSTDSGNTWSPPTQFIKTGSGDTRPYVKYRSDYNSRIDVLYTDAHPDNYTCSLYHTYPTNLASAVTGNTISISWAASHLGWILQEQTDSIATGLGTNWVDLPGTVGLVSTNLSIDPMASSTFFRLCHP